MSRDSRIVLPWISTLALTKEGVSLVRGFNQISIRVRCQRTEIRLDTHGNPAIKPSGITSASP